MGLLTCSRSSPWNERHGFESEWRQQPIIEIDKEKFLDKVHVKVEINNNAFEGTLTDLERLKVDITGRLKSELGVNPVVHLVEPGSLPENVGKAVRVFDYRGQ